MATYYIDPGGDDGDAGGSGTPRLTIQGGIALMSATDTLILNDGSYNGESQWRTPNAIPNGTSTSSYTKFQAANDYQAIIRAPAGSGAAVWPSDNRQYVWWHGLVLQGGTSSGSRSGNSGFFGCANTSTLANFGEYLKFSNFKVKWFNKTGIFGSCNNSLFTNFETFQNGTDPDHDHGGYISDFCHHNIYEYCTIYDNASNGFQFFSTSKNPHDHIIRYFVSYDNVKNGIVIYRDRNSAHYGIVYGNNAGVQMRSGNDAHCYNVIAYNNTTGIVADTGMDGAVIKNCISLGNSLQYANNGSNTVATNNVFSGTTAAAIWTDPANADFTLKNTAGTPAADVTTYLIDQGISVGLSVDGEGTPVPQGGEVDIGHLEWANTDPPDAPSLTTLGEYTVAAGVYTPDVLSLSDDDSNTLTVVYVGTNVSVKITPTTNVTVTSP